MFLALLLLAAPADWVPARWPSGDPKSLELLAGTPINTLLLESRHWDAALVRQAASRGIVALGVIHAGDNAAELARLAARLKLNGIVLEGDFAPGIGGLVGGRRLMVIELPSRGRIHLDKPGPVTGTAQALWPGIEIEHGGSVSTGPTSAPWIVTNTGFLRFLAAATKAPVWVGERPPPHKLFPAERYLLAVADAAIAGARWIISLDDDFQRRLFARETRALADWARISGTVRYFESNPEWRSYAPFSQLALVQDTASGGLLSSGLLDMLSVQHTAARPLPAHELSEERLHDTHVVLDVDVGSLEPQQKQALDQFARAGGKVVNPPPGWRFPSPAPDQMVPTRQEMNQIQPIWEITYDATLRKNFGARTFNTSTIIFALRASPGARRMLLHLVNYADYAAEDVAVQVLGTWHTARLYSPDGPPRNLPVYPVRDGTGIDVDRISLLGTLLVE